MKIYLVLETPKDGGSDILRATTTRPDKALEFARYIGRNLSPKKVNVKSITEDRVYSAEEAGHKRLVVYTAHRGLFGKWKEKFVDPLFEQEAKPALVG